MRRTYLRRRIVFTRVMYHGTPLTTTTMGGALTQGRQVRRHVGGILVGDAQVGHSCVGLDPFWVAQPQHHIGLRVGQRARDQGAAGLAAQRRSDIGKRAGYAWNGVAGAAGVLVERLFATGPVGRTYGHGIYVAAAKSIVTLPLGDLRVRLWRELRQVLQKCHHIPYLTIRQTVLPRRHAGEADAMAGNPIQLTRMKVLRRINQRTGQRLHALTDVVLRNARRAMALRALILEARCAAADHSLSLQRRRLDVARVQANRAVHGELQHRVDGLQVLARRADVVETRPDETRSNNHAKGDESCNRGEDKAGAAHGVQPIVYMLRRSVLCALSLISSTLMVVLLSACSGKPTPLHAQQDPQQAARGKLLLAQYQCGSCHVIPGVAASRGSNGPNLQAFSQRSYISGNVPNELVSLVRWIVDPKALIPATTMPAMGVSPSDARAMAAYLHTLQ